VDRRDREKMAATMRALAHPTRLEVLAAVNSEEQSPSQFSDAGPGRPTLGTASHHFRALRRAGLIEVSATEQRRGAIMRSYRPTATGARVNRWLGRLR